MSKGGITQLASFSTAYLLQDIFYILVIEYQTKNEECYLRMPVSQMFWVVSNTEISKFFFYEHWQTFYQAAKRVEMGGRAEYPF